MDDSVAVVSCFTMTHRNSFVFSCRPPILNKIVRVWYPETDPIPTIPISPGFVDDVVPAGGHDADILLFGGGGDDRGIPRSSQRGHIVDALSWFSLEPDQKPGSFGSSVGVVKFIRRASPSFPLMMETEAATPCKNFNQPGDVQIPYEILELSTGHVIRGADPKTLRLIKVIGRDDEWDLLFPTQETILDLVGRDHHHHHGCPHHRGRQFILVVTDPLLLPGYIHNVHGRFCSCFSTTLQRRHFAPHPAGRSTVDEVTAVTKEPTTTSLQDFVIVDMAIRRS